MSDTTAADLAEYEADATEDVGDENILAAITRVARELRQAQDRVILAEDRLKLAQDRVRTLEERTLPDLMDQAAQKELVTTDGYRLVRGETLRASIPPANLAEAVMWLKANGQEAIVKRHVGIDFGKGEGQKAAEAVDALREHGFMPTDKQSVHPQTLGATIREMVQAGVDVPLALLGVYVQQFVKMTAPGKKTGRK